MKNRNKKFLVESARITDAYLGIYANVNEAVDSNVNAKMIQNKKKPLQKPVQSTSSSAKNGGGSNATTNLPSNRVKQPVGKAKTATETEYPEPETEFTSEELDYLEGKTDKRPLNFPADARKRYGGYQQSNESCCDGKKNAFKSTKKIKNKVNEVADGKLHVDPVDIYTIQISRVLDNGDQDGIDEMKYAKTYYDIHDAIEDAKKAYSEYAGGEDSVVVDILAGEQEHESGDIYGEPYVILTVKDGKLLDMAGAEVDTTEEEFIGNIDDANESYEDNGEIDYGDDGSKYAEDYADDKLKNAISVIKRICTKNGAKVIGISEGNRTHAIVNIKIKDPNKVPGVGFDMNRIMGIGYGIEKACEKAGINAFIAGGYVGNNAQIYLSKDNPIVESYATKVMGNISPEDVEAADLGLISDEAADPYNFDNDDEEEEEVSNEEILAQYRKFLGNRIPVVETKEGEIYFEYDPKRNVLAYGGASNTGLIENGHIDYDKSQSMLWNLEQLHDEIYEKYGYSEEE